LHAGSTKEVASYLIILELGEPPKFYLLDPGSLGRTPVGAEAVPPGVLKYVAWLIAFAEGHALPPNSAPKFIGNIKERKQVAAIVSDDESGPTTVH
jgi:hypothetical protein